MRRPTAGDKVRVIGCSFDISDTLLGQEGRIIRDDHDCQPYKIQFANGNAYFFCETDVELIEEAPTPSKPERELHVGDKVRVKSREWYEANKGASGVFEFDGCLFTPDMAQYCGKVSEIVHARYTNRFMLKDCPNWPFSKEMLELVEPPSTSIKSDTSKTNLQLIQPNKLLTNIKLD